MGIFVGIPRAREYEPFRESLSVFLEAVKKKYEVEVMEVHNKTRDDAREEIADAFLKSDKDYLLFLDDDHEGHTVEMLDALFKPDALFCSMKCYARYFPFQITTCSKDMNYQDRNSLYVKNTNKGYSECHFVGFGMALLKRELFSKIEKPYFKCNDIGEREDNYFCEKLINAGIKPIGCFDYALSHSGINDDTVLERRQKGMKEFTFRNNQRLMIKKIKAKIRDEGLKVDDMTKGRLEVMDFVLNHDVIVNK